MPLSLWDPPPHRPRLKGFSYRGLYTYFVTIGTHNSEAVFTSDEPFNLVFDILMSLTKEKGFELLAYCFMPDHLHLLVSGVTIESDLQKFISMFKQKSGFYYRKKFGKKLWHISYYEHVLRKDEDVELFVKYILNNPVRKEMVSCFSEYPYSGLKRQKSRLKP